MSATGRWPAWIRRLVCRIKGHRVAGGAIYRPGHAKVGTGCTRCGVGVVREYRCQFPVPRA